MAVVIEVLSLVIRADRVAAAWPGGWTAFEAQVRDHPSYCCDTELARLAFLKEEDMANLIHDLRAAGLRYVVEGPAGRRTEDMVVIDQDKGPLEQAEWLEFYHVDMAKDGPQRAVPVARRAGSKLTRTAFPKDWRWEDSSFARGRPS